jgi:hypothetical protein
VYRRRAPGQKYCERCRIRRSSARDRRGKSEVSCPVATPKLAAGTYLVRSPLFAILTLESEKLPITIPVNAFIDAPETWDAVSEKTLVDIEWNARKLVVFVHDLQSRASLVPPEGRSQG